MVDSMITLYESTVTEFSNNGLGSLPDAVSCLITEERNGEYELEMEYPITGKRYDELLLRRIILAKPNPYADSQPFRIYAITKPINGIVTVNAEHISYDMSGYPVSPFTAGTITTALSNMKNASVVPCPFIFSTDKDTTAQMSISKPTSMRALLGGIEGSILDVYRGEYEFDRFNVKLWNNRGLNRGVSIRYGKNLTDLEQEENCSAVYTGVYPFWYSDEGGLVELSEKVVNAEGTYDFTRIYPLDLSDEWQEIPTEDQLLSKAQSYMKLNKIGIPKVSLTVSFVPLAQTEDYKDFAILETVHLCDTVNVYFPEMNVSATSQCIKTVYDVITRKYNKIELGDAKANLASTVSEQTQSISKVPSKTFMEQAIDNATKLITGGLGGYVILHSSTGGKYPDEILIMDTPDIRTAVDVWRWNQNGFGHSSTGYEGPYDTAVTMDGQIVANFITTGILNGSLLLANSVESSAISQHYKDEVTNEIGDATSVVEQAFIAADGRLESIISQIKENLDGDISELNQTIAALQQTIDGFNFSITNKTIGGINFIRNSSGLNGVSNDWNYTGTVTALQNATAQNNTVSGSLFQLRAGTLSQEITVIKGKQYTLSFKALRNTVNRCYVRVHNGGSDSYIFDTQASNYSWEDYVFTFTAFGDTVKITSGTTGSSLYVADFMMVEGDSKSNWTPAPNEIYTENVKIDRRGINITNSESSTETIIDHTQFAVKHSGETVLTVNKDLTTLCKTEVTDELTIGKGKFVPCSNGLNFVLLD